MLSPEFKPPLQMLSQDPKTQVAERFSASRERTTTYISGLLCHTNENCRKIFKHNIIDEFLRLFRPSVAPANQHTWPINCPTVSNKYYTTHGQNYILGDSEQCQVKKHKLILPEIYNLSLNEWYQDSQNEPKNTDISTMTREHFKIHILI